MRNSTLFIIFLLASLIALGIVYWSNRETSHPHSEAMPVAEEPPQPPQQPRQSQEPQEPQHHPQPNQPQNQTQGLSPQHQMSELIKETHRKMPTMSDVRKLRGEEVHHTPRIISEAFERIAEIGQLLRDHPELKHEASQFYQECTTQREYPTSIRAMCLYKLKKTDPESASPEHLHVSKRVRELADQL